MGSFFTPAELAARLERKPWASEIPPVQAWGALLLAAMPFSGLRTGMPLEAYAALVAGLIAFGGNFAARLRVPDRNRRLAILYPALMILLYLDVWISGVLWQRLLDGVGIPYRAEQELLEVLRRLQGGELYFLVFSLTVTTPVIEELIFRRVLFGLFRPLGPYHALFLTSVLFAAAHSFLLGIPGLLAMGLAFQLGYLLSGSLLLPVLMHMTVNTVTVAWTLYS